jgi:hypothetical protein
MKWLLVALIVLSTALIVGGALTFVYWEECKPFIDAYANHASVLGFFVSVVGFILTVWAVFETLRVSTKAQIAVQEAVIEARQETRLLLDKIRSRMMEDTCEQAFLFASKARYAIRSSSWLRAAERCDDARQLTARMLTFPDLTETERVALRAIIEDLKTTIAFIERYRLKKKDAPAGMPDEKRQSVDSLIDELEKIRARLQQRILEVSHADYPVTDRTTN